jgi:hypothetical protein
MFGSRRDPPAARSRRVIFRRQSILLLLLVGILLPLGKAPAAPAGAHHAGVVVRGGDGQVHTACVSFDESSISGLALLERAGLDVNVQVSSGGATVCSIAGQGCHFPSQACFCQCQGGGPCRYWSYWHLVGGVWQYAATGAASYQVQPGGVDGWIWGGSSGGDDRPPVVSFDNICPLPEATPRLPTVTLPKLSTALPASTAVQFAPSITPELTIAAATPVPLTSTATPSTPPAASSGTPVGQYVLFGGTVVVLLAAIVLAVRRRK